MIRRETKYIIRRILIGVGIALILGYINACEVKAETNFISPIDLSMRYYYNNSNYENYYASNCTDSTCQYDTSSSSNFPNKVYFRTGNGGYTFNNTKLIMFNVGITRNVTTQELRVNNVSFNNLPCYYSVNNSLYYLTDEVPQVLNSSISAYCPYNGNLILNGNTNIIEINIDYTIQTKWFLSKVKVISDSSADNIIALLQTNNGYQLTQQNLLTQIRDDILAQTQTINGTISSFSNRMHDDNLNIQQNQQGTTNAINDMNDTIKDNSIDSPNSSISQMEQNLPTNSVISDLLTLPIRMFQNIVNAVNGTCSPFSLGALFGTNLVLPCINIDNYLGSALWGAIDVIFCGIFVLSMRKKFVEIFENITSLKNGGNELE